MSLQRISGNNGTDEKYVVVAKNGNVALGVYFRAVSDFYRPTIEGINPTSITGRLRVAAAPGCEATDVEINEAFKALPLEKFANDHTLRASLSLGIFLNQIQKSATADAFDAQQVGFKLYAFLTKYIGEDFMLVTAAQLHDALKMEITSSTEEVSISAFTIAREIGKSDTAFSSKVDVIIAALDAEHEKATEIYKAARKKARGTASEAMETLVDAYLETHPDFTVMRSESTETEIKLLSFLYEGLAPALAEDVDPVDVDPQYDA